MTEPTEASLGLSQEDAAFYRQAMRQLQEADVPFLVGGAYAFENYTGITRHTKDIDLFLRKTDLERAMRVFDLAGFRTEADFAHWLAKAYEQGASIDLVYRSGNGIAMVDDAWFERAVDDEVLGVEVALCPPEEMLWTKAFVMERERYDGADVAHLLRGCADDVDWAHLLDRFGAHWRVLFSHLMLFGFIYPSERDRIPQAVIDELLQRMQDEPARPPSTERICRGTLLSRAQYLVDVREWGYADARLRPRGDMDTEEIRSWTDAIDETERPQQQGRGAEL